MSFSLFINTTLITLLFIVTISTSIAQEDKPIKFTISIQQSINHPKSKIEFERTDSNIKWFDDKNTSANSDLIYGFIVPLNQVNINYRKHTIRGMHNGKALKETCIFISCFWASSSLISGLESNDRMQYKIDNNELWIEKPFYKKNHNSLIVSPIIGINIIPAKFIIIGEGRQEFKSETLSIPFWGVKLEKKLSKTIRVSGEFHHLNYNNSEWGFLYQNYQVGIEKNITKDIDVSIGYSKYRFNTEYKKNSKDAKFDLFSNSPFIKISTHF